MKTQYEYIMSIMYSPVSYIHPEYLPDESANPNKYADVLVNYWILKTYMLEDLPEDWQASDPVSGFLLPSWGMIPSIARLIGGFLIREKLLLSSAMLITDPRLLAFISLPLVHDVVINEKAANHTPTECGLAFIHGLTTAFPKAITQRLQLLFPANLILPELDIMRTPQQINLLRMAINYANDFKK